MKPGGLEDYYEVILAQNIERGARLSAIDIQTRRMTADVSLIKALGGGWNRKDGLNPDADWLASNQPANGNAK
ncbi:RND efflux system outer membrane lipoprotein [Caballeronia hypogeia]|uniref:RND efflux system outer membrane lipoprotein n=1 Tax=Caballeronia hypogeia TaxID=1777140 RepID=A0A158D4Q3_9BURK|nr:hypothetical protein [Caballeronia hypogeia]SAK89186.1 RND efflux system outer membrane lipoprotein [Caballeronia hypogeia]